MLIELTSCTRHRTLFRINQNKTSNIPGIKREGDFKLHVSVSMYNIVSIRKDLFYKMFVLLNQ
jgi:hypothetical protein